MPGFHPITPLVTFRCQGDIPSLHQEEFDAMMSGTGTPSSTKVVYTGHYNTDSSSTKAPGTKKTPSRKRETSSQVRNEVML